MTLPMTPPRFVQCEHAPGQHERPGGGVHRKRLAVAEMLLPIGASDTVLDQRIGGCGIGYAQQRFGEAQQRHAFRGAEAVLGEEVGDIGTGPVRGTCGMHERACTSGNAWRRCRECQQRRQDVCLGRAVEAAEVCPVVSHKDHCHCDPREGEGKQSP